VRVLYCDVGVAPGDAEDVFTIPEDRVPDILKDVISTEAEVPTDDAGEVGRKTSVGPAEAADGSRGRDFACLGELIDREIFDSELNSASRVGDRGERGGGA
jgi:hypothetical protein